LICFPLPVQTQALAGIAWLTNYGMMATLADKEGVNYTHPTPTFSQPT